MSFIGSYLHLIFFLRFFFYIFRVPPVYQITIDIAHQDWLIGHCTHLACSWVWPILLLAHEEQKAQFNINKKLLGNLFFLSCARSHIRYCAPEEGDNRNSVEVFKRNHDQRGYSLRSRFFFSSQVTRQFLAVLPNPPLYHLPGISMIPFFWVLCFLVASASCACNTTQCDIIYFKQPSHAKSNSTYAVSNLFFLFFWNVGGKCWLILLRFIWATYITIMLIPILSWNLPSQISTMTWAFFQT